jgi:hypothetical protein
MPRPDSRLLLLVGAVAVAACSHSEPFVPGGNGSTGSHDSTPPVQLTFNIGLDLQPAWTPDDKAILYSFEQPTRADDDHCIGRLPSAGGTRTLEKCALSDPTGTRVDALLSPTLSAGGRLAWVQFAGVPRQLAPTSGAIRVGVQASTDSGIAVRTLPYVAPSGNPHTIATDLQWLGETTLAYIGSEVVYVLACSGCNYDTLLVGSEVTRLDFATSPATVTVLPGTAGATSLWVSRDGATFYYTLQGDSKVYQQPSTGGTSTITHDFGAGRIVRDVSVSGTTLLAVVDGRAVIDSIPVAGPTQRDSGGLLAIVDLQTGTATVLPDYQFFYRHARLAANGLSAVAEAYPLTINVIRDGQGSIIAVDTSVATIPDLRLVTP